jgi:hypothetical protein
MGIVHSLAGIAMRQLVRGALDAVGAGAAGEGVEAVVAFLGERFTDHSQRLSKALGDANERAWTALEVALAGESFWERWQVRLARSEDQAFRQQVRAFLDAAPLADVPGEGPAFRQRCLQELRAVRRAGLLAAGSLAPRVLAREAGAWGQFDDPGRLLDAEWGAVGRVADDLEQAGHAHLARLLRLRPAPSPLPLSPKGRGEKKIPSPPGGEGTGEGGSPPLVAVAVRYFFRRAVEDDPKLFQALAFARWEALAEGQERGFAGLNRALAEHGQRVEAMLDEVQTILAETHGAVLDLQGEFREFVRAFRAAAGQVEKRVAAGFEGRRVDATRLCLRVAGRNVCLLARREVRLGKNRDNDVVVRVLPPSPANDAQTDRISRHHALLQFTRDEVVWRNLGSNGTVVAGQPLPAGASRALYQGATVSPAGVLPLTCTLCYDEPPAGAEVYTRFEQRLGFPGAPPPPQRVQAVRLRRQDGLAGREEYVVFPRGVFVGSDPACPVRVEDPSAAPLHAQVLWLGGGFWLEPLQASRTTLAERRPVAPDHLVPLYPGLTLTLGAAELTVAPYHQMHIDF